MMQKLRDVLSRLQRDERGMTTVEYAIVLCLIAAVAVGAWQTFGHRVQQNLENADDAVNGPLETAVGGG